MWNQAKRLSGRPRHGLNEELRDLLNIKAPRGMPRPASSPTFDPQWSERALEAEMDEPDEWDVDQCRLCACTEYSACDGGCWWVAGDLCSRCDALMRRWAALRLADGYGIAAFWAFAQPVSEGMPA